jgi:hypothetical protein
MAANTKLEELLLRWEDNRRQGRRISIEELCRDSPELKQELQWQIKALEGMDQAMATSIPSANQRIDKSPRRSTRYDKLGAGWEPVPGYCLEMKLGKGGFGEVWKAKGPGGFSVALKFVPLPGKMGPIELRSLEILKSLRHPNLLATFGSWQAHGFLIVAMELAERTILDRLHEAISQTCATDLPRNQAQTSLEFGMGIPREESWATCKKLQRELTI